MRSDIKDLWIKMILLIIYGLSIFVLFPLLIYAFTHAEELPEDDDYENHFYG